MATMKTCAWLIVCLQLLTPTIKVVTLESLSASPKKYDGQEVIVAARVLRGEGLYVMMPNEKDMMWVFLKDSLSKSPSPTDTRFIQRLRERPNAIAMLRGHFFGGTDSRFGHQSCCRFKLEVDEVLSVD
jgi:hypothetical protein